MGDGEGKMKKASPMRSLIAWERLSMITLMLDALRGLPRRGGLGSYNKDLKEIKDFKELRLRHIWSSPPGGMHPGITIISAHPG